MSLSLIGIIFVQGYWISESVSTKREQFAKNVVTTFQIRAKVKKRAKRVKLYYRSNKDENFTSVFMNDDGLSNDGKKGDKIFGATVDPKGAYDSIEYYILTENAKAISFDPPNYMFEPYTSNISELNK